MWHPFKRVTLEAVTKNESDISVPAQKIKLSDEIQTAQLRSLKARTEISMIYERMAESALANLKGNTRATNI